MTMKILRAAVAVVLLAGLGTIGAPSSAGPSACPTGKLCLYEHNDFGGWKKEIGGRPRVVNLKGDYNDNASSLINQRGKVVFLYSGKNATGTRVCVLGSTSANDLGGIYGFNDEASSVKLTRKTSCPT